MPLSSLDPNQLSLSSRPSSSPSSSLPKITTTSSSSSMANSDNGTGSEPATPSKDKMREWTFPRSSTSTSNTKATSGAPRGPRVEISSTSSSAIHARSSSIAPSSSTSSKSPSSIDPSSVPLIRGGGTSSSRDFRHRTNASLAFASSATPELGSSQTGGFSQLPAYSSISPSSSSPAAGLLGTLAGEKEDGLNPKAGEVARMVYSNVRRKGLNDVVYFIVFGGAFLLFFSALFGVGHPSPSSSSSSSSSSFDLASKTSAVEDVRIPDQFLRQEQEGESPLADVHSPNGDTSHDDGIEHFGKTEEGWKEVIGDEEVHSHPLPTARPPSDPALFPLGHQNSLKDLEAEHEAGLVRPRPARLPVIVGDEGEGEAGWHPEPEMQQEEEEEEEGVVGGHRGHEGHEEEHEGLDEVVTGEDEDEGFEVEVGGAEVANPGETEEEEEEQAEEVDLSATSDDVDVDSPSEEEEEGDEAEAEAEVDDSIDPLNPAHHSDGSLHLVSEEDDEEALTALEELLDAGLAEEEEEEEEQAELMMAAGGGGSGAGPGAKEELEALARARAKQDGQGMGEKRRLGREEGQGEQQAERRRMVRKIR
ncbi:hypothetical protein JCM11641_006517 [Rhodosporidiobolus odoratus]